MKFKFTLFLFLLILSSAISLSSCDKDPVIQKETVTVYDTVFVSVTDTLIIPLEEKITSFILVRHAEKIPVGDDPFLTVEGLERANELARVLSTIKLDRVYSTDYNRTMQTATPTAEDQSLDITPYGGFDQDEVIDEILQNLSEGIVLIVGHGNTTADFLNVLTGTTDYPDLEEDSFDNIFIVSCSSKGDSEVINIKYGK